MTCTECEYYFDDDEFKEEFEEFEADVEIYDNEVDKLELSLLNCAKGFEDMIIKRGE